MSGKGRKGAELWAHAQAAEKAAAQSNREISGYRIESISLTHERQEHYLRKHVGLAGPSAPLAGLQQGGSSGLAEGFAGYASADQLGAVSGFPSQLVRLLLLHPINLTTSCCLPACSRLLSGKIGQILKVLCMSMQRRHRYHIELGAIDVQGGVGAAIPYSQQIMLSRLQGNMPQVLESMYGTGFSNQAALLQARHGIYPQQVRAHKPTRHEARRIC